MSVAAAAGVAAPAHSPIAANLEPLLREACAGRLSEVRWFRTTWQRGGAATGYATWRSEAGRQHEVVVKVPLSAVELQWLERLQLAPDVAPRLYAGAVSLGPYDLGWVVMERLAHGPLGSAWGGAEFDLMVEALGRFYAAGRSVPIPGPAPERDWPAALETARKHIARVHDVKQEQRWKNALKAAHKKLAQWLRVWTARPQQDWCHGDVQLSNGMTRQPAPAGPAVLLDYALVHPGHWVEDAVYLEHLYWARRQRLGGRKIVSQIAHERKKHGLRVDPDWPLLASVKRALLAAATPAMLFADGSPAHVQAALEALEAEVAH